MLLNDAWYVAAQSAAVGRATVTARIVGLPVVLYRTVGGEVVALEDRCPHRHSPLSLGDVVGDEIRCRYHGFQFSSGGACTAIPGETSIPPSVRARAFPVAERHGLVWVWAGEAERADPARIPPHPSMGREGFVQDYQELVVEAPFMHVVDNLMDLTHVFFVHSLLGVGNPLHESKPLSASTEGDEVIWSRDMPGKDGVFMRVGGHYYAPAAVRTFAEMRFDNGEVAPGYVSDVLHCLTPMNETSTHYTAVKCWNEKVRPDEIAAMRHQNAVTLAEDKEIIEAVYRSKLATADLPPERLIRADRAAVMARRVYDALLERSVSAPQPGSQPVAAA